MRPTTGLHVQRHRVPLTVAHGQPTDVDHVVDGELRADLPHAVDEPDCPHRLVQVDARAPGDITVVDPLQVRDRHRERRPLLPARRTRASRSGGVGGNPPQLVEDHPGQLQDRAIGGQPDDAVVQVEGAQRLHVQLEVGHVENRAPFGVLEMLPAPVDPVVLLMQPRGQLLTVGEPVDRTEQVLLVVVLDQIADDRLHRRRALICAPVERAQVVARQLKELTSPRRFPERELTDVEAQVVAQELHVLVQLELGGTLRGKRLVDLRVDQQPITEVGQLVPAVGDRRSVRRLDDVPVVDEVGDQRYARRVEVGARREQQVFVVVADGKAEAVGAQELEPVALVRRQGVVEQVGVVQDRAEHGPLGVEPGVPRRQQPAAVEMTAHTATRSEVGAGLVHRAHQRRAAALRQLVVAVEEHHVAAGCQVDAGVARRTAAATVLAQPVVADPPGSAATRRSATACVPSVLASSTMTISRSLKVCRRTERTARARRLSSL